MENERNLQYIGESWYISLPKAWVRKYNLKKGDKMRVIFSDDPVIRVIPVNIEVDEEDKQK